MKKSSRRSSVGRVRTSSGWFVQYEVSRLSLYLSPCSDSHWVFAEFLSGETAYYQQNKLLYQSTRSRLAVSGTCIERDSGSDYRLTLNKLLYTTHCV
jgi:hypothetical protein